MDEVMDKYVEKEVNKVVDEDEANAVDKKLNESSVLQDAVIVMVIVVEAIMKLTLVMQMMVDKVGLGGGRGSWRGGVPGSGHLQSTLKRFLLKTA